MYLEGGNMYQHAHVYVLKCSNKMYWSYLMVGGQQMKSFLETLKSL